MSHETPSSTLLKYLICVIHIRAIMRGKSARVGSGICSRVSEETSFLVSIADQEPFGWEGRPGPSMGLQWKTAYRWLEHLHLQSNTAMQLPKAARAVESTRTT